MGTTTSNEKRSFRDRIVGLERVKASSIVPHPKNWRGHPQEQRDALRAVLERIGVAGALLVRRQGRKLHLIDGEARLDEMRDQMVPVLVLDVTAKEADEILLTHDAIGAMAEANPVNLTALLAEVNFGDEGPLADLMTALRTQAEAFGDEPAPPVPQPDGESPDGSASAGTKMQPLFLTTSDQEALVRMDEELRPALGTTNLSDTVMACVRLAHAKHVKP
jgi:hypothetical protein